MVVTLSQPAAPPDRPGSELGRHGSGTGDDGLRPRRTTAVAPAGGLGQVDRGAARCGGAGRRGAGPGEDQGVPSILAATEKPESGKDIRGGTDNKEVLSTYTGTVPDSAVSAIIPGASGDFDATYALTSDDELRQVTLTGEFYAGHPANTYTLVLTDYGTSKDITAP